MLASTVPVHQLYAPYWNKYYDHASFSAPTPFARYAADHWLPKSTDLLELGCGNGRDALWFASLGHSVVGIDFSETAISSCRNHKSTARFEQADFSTLELGRTFSLVYSRFTLHSVDDVTEAHTLSTARRHLKSGGRFILEVRTVFDEMCGMGTRVSDREWIHENHYRRFAEPVELLSSLRSEGFVPEYIHMSRGLAQWRGQDPVVLRVSALKEAVDL